MALAWLHGMELDSLVSSKMLHPTLALMRSSFYVNQLSWPTAKNSV